MTAQPSSQAEREDVALRPCPFCGGKATVRTYETESLWSHDTVTYTQVGCEECEYQRATEPGYDPEAIEWWNTRPDREHATPRSMPEEVVEAIWKRACEGREGYCSSDLQDAARWAIGEAFRLAEQAARSVTLPAGYQWSDGNREKFDFGRDTAAAAIRALIPGASA